MAYSGRNLKPRNKTAQADNREDTRFVHRFHRQLGLIVSFVMLTFHHQRRFHLIVKLHNIARRENYSS
jgi:hypothetical protein